MADFGATRMILPQEQNYDLSNLTYLPGVTRRSTRSQAIGAGGRFNDSSQRPQINIPPAARSFVDLNSAYLNFKLTVSYSNTPVENDHHLDLYMIGSPASIFRELNWYSNSSSQLLENVGNYGQLSAVMRNLSYQEAAVAGAGVIGLMIGPGTGNTANKGHTFTTITKTAPGSRSLDCFVPILGSFAANSKFLPVFQAEHNLFIDLNPYELWLRNGHNDGTNPVDMTGVSYEISELMLIYDTVTLDVATFDAFRAAYPPPSVGLPSILPIRTVSYEYREQLIPEGTTNFTWSLPLHISSIRRFFFTWNRSQLDATGCADGNLGSVNPNLRNIMVRANGVPFPQSGLDCTKPITVLAADLTSFGALHTAWAYNPRFSAAVFTVSDTATGAEITDYASYNKPNMSNQSSALSNCFYVIIDTEALQNRDDLVSGIAAQGASVFVEMQMLAATTEDWNMRCWVEHDRIIQYDLNSPMVAVKY